jgi:hypothetical protein
VAPDDPRDDLEYVYSLPSVHAGPDGQPAPATHQRIRTVAIVLFVVAGILLLAYVGDLILSHHDAAPLRLFGAICGAVAIFLVRQFPLQRAPSE